MADARAPGAPLEFCVLVRMAPGKLAERLRRLSEDGDCLSIFEDDDGPFSVLGGDGLWSAVVVWEPGSIGSERDIATALAEETGGTVYAIGLRGHDDPDDGLPFIERHERGEHGLVWMADAPDLPTVPGPDGVPKNDPFAFARALLGRDLPPYRAR
jgi:hypothetical protein